MNANCTILTLFSTEKPSVSSWLTPDTNVTCGKPQITQRPLPRRLTDLLPVSDEQTRPLAVFGARGVLAPLPAGENTLEGRSQEPP